METKNNDRNNYTGKLYINITNEQFADSIENKDYGNEFENFICTKSCVNLKIKSINNKKIYTKQYRHFAGLKVLLINENRDIKDIVYYIKNKLDEGQYKVIPYSNYYYSISFYNQYFYISYYKGEVVLQDNYYNIINPYFIKKHKDSLKYSSTSSSDIYRGSFYIYNKGKEPLTLIIFSSEAEVDGCFEVKEETQLSVFQVPISFMNYQEKNICADSLLFYEIKSGDKQNQLKNQMKKRCHFIINYLRIFYGTKVPIYYIGFYRDKNNCDYESDSEKNYILKENLIDENKEGKINDNSLNNNGNVEKINVEELTTTEEDKNSDNNSPLENENQDEGKDEDKNLEEGIKIKQIVEVEKKEKSEEIKDEIILHNFNENKNEISSINEDYSSLNNLPAKIVIFKLQDSIFGEKFIYEKEELNLIGNLRDDVTLIKQDVKEMKKKMDSVEQLLKLILNKIGIEIKKENKTNNENMK